MRLLHLSRQSLASLPLVVATCAAFSAAPSHALQAFTTQEVVPVKFTWPIENIVRFQQTLMADVDGDSLRDLAFVDDGRLRFVFAPSIFGTVMNLQWQSNDIDVARDPGGNGDEVVSVGTNGLYGHRYAPGGWVNRRLNVPNGIDPWLGAKHVAVRELPSGENQVFGVMSNGVDLRVVRKDPGGLPEDAFLIASPDPVHDLAFFDRDGDGDRELAVMTDDRVYILEVSLNGNNEEVWSVVDIHLSLGFEAVGLARGAQALTPPSIGVPAVQQAREWLAWVGTWPITGEQYFSTVRDTGLGTPVLVESSPGVVALASGDWNWDGDTDVGFGWTQSTEVGVLTNQGTTEPVFDYAFSTVIQVGSNPSLPNPDNESPPGISDGDNDGDDDAFVLLENESALWVGFNRKVLEDDWKPILQAEEDLGHSDPNTVPEDLMLVEKDVSGVDKLFLEFTVNHPATLPPGANHVEIAIFEQPPGVNVTALVPTGDTNPAAVDYDRQFVDASNPQSLSFSLALEGAQFTEHPEHGCKLDALYYWMQRYVIVVDGQVRHAYPAEVYGCHVKGQEGVAPPLDDEDADECGDYLEAYALSGAPVIPIESFVSCDTGPSPITLTIVGSARPIPCLPNLPCDVPVSWIE